MYSLIITVKSIEAVARMGEDCLSALKFWCQHTASNQILDDDYAIPSLIWPPPRDPYPYSYLHCGGASHA